MVVYSLTLANFRNYEKLDLVFSRGINVICGNNAQGKTNLLEAVHFLSGMKSFRALREREVIRFGRESAQVRCVVNTQERDYEISADIYIAARRRVLVNGVAKKGTGLLKTVLFLPDDLNMIKDGAAVRRRFLDATLSQLRPAYARALRDYNRSLMQKLKLLKQEDAATGRRDMIDVFNQKMAQTGAQLVLSRDKYIRKLSLSAAQIHHEISGGKDNLSLTYQTAPVLSPDGVSAGQAARQIYESLLAHEKKELAARACLVGPHKDDLLVDIGGSPARYYGSQGQTRTACLSLKLAEREIIYEDGGEYPVLLLDDVLSELDPVRRDFVLNKITGGQVMITCCEENLLHNEGRTFHIESGRVAGQYDGKETGE